MKGVFMPEEHTQQPTSRGKGRRERVEYARSRDILNVASELNMELVRSGRDYRWKEHDSMVISPDKNMWNWFSRHQGGDVISLVETMKEVNFNQAIDYLNDGSFKEYKAVERAQETFSYYLEPYEQPFETARIYLKDQRGLSDETIDFFLEKGVLAQANAKVNGSIETVVVFKSFDFSGEIVGATLQGIEENWEKWPERGYAKNIVRNSDGITGLHVDIGQPNRLIFAESAIDLMSYYELNKDNLQDVRLISMDGLKEGVIGRHLAQLQSDISGRPLRWSYDQLAEGLQTAIDNNFFIDGKHADWITLAVDNDEAGQNFINSLREKGAVVTEDLPNLKDGQEKMDWNDALKSKSNGKNGRVEVSTETYEAILQQLRDETIIITPEVTEEDIVNPRQEIISSSEETEKPLDSRQEVALNSEQQKNERTSQYKGSLQPEAEGSTTPVSETDTFDRSVTSRPTRSSHYLNFTIKDGFKSRHTRLDHSVDKAKLAKLNRFSDTIQEAAKYYQKELANSEISYFTADGNIVQVNFLEKNFMHLTGLKFIGKNQSPEKTLSDLAAGGEISFDDIRISNSDSAFDKIKVLPELKAVLQTDSFYFDQLQNIDRYTDRFDSLIKSRDKDIMVLFKATDENGTVPASIFKSREILENELEAVRRNEIIGIFRKREGVIEQIAINEEYVKDGGQEILSILQNKQYEESDVDFESTQIDVLSAKQFTQVLDAAYNVGDPRKLGTQIPEESKEAWKRYYELSDTHEGNFSAIVGTAEQLELVDKDSNFYKEWAQDRIYNENYHIRLQWAEKWPEGPQLPFEESSLASYQDFVTELYKANQEVYQAHQESIAQVNAENLDNYVPPTKIKFNIYAPGGQVIKEGVRYDIGDETEPVSRLLGLGYRRLDGQSELAAIDEVVLSQLENQEVNQDIATEANEQTVVSQEIPQAAASREDFQSPKQGIKNGLAKRVEEIMAEDATKILVSSIPQIQENLSMEGDLIGTPQSDGQMLYTNQENFGRDYQLELAVHSPVKIDQLSDIQAPWALALIQGEHKLGYLAYGSDWGNDFQIKKDLEKLASQIGVGNSPEGLYKQEEIDAFLTNNNGSQPDQRTQENISSAEPFDYKTALAYDVSERAFQKIREYTQSPEDLMEYMEFMSKFPQLSPRNVALIQDQWKGANAVATYDQWKSMGEALGIKKEDVIQTKATYTNKRTGETKEVVHQGLSVKTGEKSQITLFRPVMVRMIPVIDENGNHVKNDKGNPKYKKLSEATPQEKALVKDGKLSVRQFQKRDPRTGQPRFTTYKVFELSQTTLKLESYPKAMPNRHYNFDTDKVKTKEVLEGLCDYAESIGVSMMKDEAHVLGNAKGAFFPEEQLILINPDNTSGEKIATTIHELAHATLHNPNLSDQYKELPKAQKELEAEMTSHLLSKHFGLDTSEKAINYIAKWTDNLQGLDDKQLAASLKRIHKTVSKMHKQIESHIKPYHLGKTRGQNPNFSKAPINGPSR